MKTIVTFALLLLVQPYLAFSADCAPRAGNLVGWWPGEGDATDLVNGNNGTLSGVTFAPGEVGSGFVLDGASYVEIPDAQALRLSADSPSSLDAWIYPTAWPSAPVVPVTATKPYYYGLLYFPGEPRLRANIHDGHQWLYLDATYALPLNEWVHVAQTWDGTDLSIYVNGSLLRSGHTVGNSYPRLELPAYVGRWLVTGGDPQEFLFTGLMDEVGIYNRALAPSKVDAIFRAGSAGRCTGPLPPPITAELIQVGPRCVSLVLTSELPLKGGEFGIACDPAVATLAKVAAGPDLPAGATIQFQSSAPSSCAPESGVTGGFTIGWLTSTTGDAMIPEGKHDLLKLCFALAEGAHIDDCSDLSFVQCLGPIGAPVRNIVTNGEGKSVQLAPTDGRLCLGEELAFRRGDANADGNLDISDAIAILGCLFLGTACSACADSQDTNDDGHVNIADPTYMLHWRFLGGPAPPPPFLSCGQDETADEIDECEGDVSC